MEVEVRFQPSEARLRVDSLQVEPLRVDPLRVQQGTTLLEAARRVGLPMASACGADGICGRCGVRVLSGAEALSAESANEAEVKRRNRIDPDLRLACRAGVHGPVTVSASYW
jgi:ferredoxin